LQKCCFFKQLIFVNSRLWVLTYLYEKRLFMAKQTGLFRFTGKLDNVIGYRRNGKHCVRSMPETVRQTPATRRAARNFGIASRKGRLIRRAITPYLGRYDGTTVNRLNKALVQLPNQQLQGLEGFRFNRHTGLDKLLPLLPVVTANGQVKIPAQELPHFPRATHREICLIAARVNFAERRIEDVQAVMEIISLKEDFNGLQLELPEVAGKGTLILTVQVQACDSTNGRIQPLHDRRYMAADIIAVIPPRPHGKERRKHGFSFTEKQAVDRALNSDVVAGSSAAKARGATKQSPEYWLSGRQSLEYSLSGRGSLRPPGSQ
jgi:hypothetical protein